MNWKPILVTVPDVVVMLTNVAGVALRRVLTLPLTEVGLAITAGKTPRYILRFVPLIDVILAITPGTTCLVPRRLTAPLIVVVDVIRSGELPPAVTVDTVPIADGVGAVTRATVP